MTSADRTNPLDASLGDGPAEDPTGMFQQLYKLIVTPDKSETSSERGRVLAGGCDDLSDAAATAGLTIRRSRSLPEIDRLVVNNFLF